MATCSLDALIADAVANRFTGLTPDRYSAVLLQLLYDIQGMTGNIDTIISDATANRFTGLTPDRLEAAIVQLLCDIAGGSGSGGGTITQEAGPVSGWADPADTGVTSLKWNSTDGILYVWNTDTLAWEPTA